jgi:hypothetical protein
LFQPLRLLDYGEFPQSLPQLNFDLFQVRDSFFVDVEVLHHFGLVNSEQQRVLGDREQRWHFKAHFGK